MVTVGIGLGLNRRRRQKNPRQYWPERWELQFAISVDDFACHGSNLRRIPIGVFAEHFTIGLQLRLF
jgi:hypothetical protein